MSDWTQWVLWEVTAVSAPTSAGMVTVTFAVSDEVGTTAQTIVVSATGCPQVGDQFRLAKQQPPGRDSDA